MLHRFLAVFEPRLLDDVSREWLADLHEFVKSGLPKLLTYAFCAWVLIFLVNFITRRIIRVAERRANTGVARAAQVRTLASVVRATGIGIVVFLTFLQVMENVLHVNLGPLLASAGVAGVAIGLASQTLVKDVLNGMLVLLEDQYNVGDVVTLAGMTGVVDSMTLRKTTLRGFDGTLYLIPNSQITNVANQSRDFSVSTINISVDFSANPDEVIPLLKTIVSDVRNEPAFKDVFLDNPQVLGVDSIKGSEVIYPVVIKTRARQQYEAMREIQRRIRSGLEAHGILPGNPYRVITADASLRPHRGNDAHGAPDPTTAKPNETNPFTATS